MTAHVGRGNRLPDDVAGVILERVSRGLSIDTAAALAGYSGRSLHRWARRSADNRAALMGAVDHGRRARLLTRHHVGCGCGAEECRRRNAARKRAYAAKKAASGFAGLRHGAVATYGLGCRCADCTRIHSAACAERRRRRQAAAA